MTRKDTVFMDEINEQTVETAENTETAAPSEPAAEKAAEENGAEEKAEEKKAGTFTESMYEAVSVVISSITIIALVFTFAFRLVGVVGHSMDTTLNDGDWLVVTPYYGEPEYGDIVISTKKTAAEDNIVKRVIAVGGDEVIVDETDTVFVNGEKREESSYAIQNGRQYGNLVYPVTVPENSVMLMGDNRPGSWDSRFAEIGFAENDYLLGKARLRLSLKNWNIYDTFKK